MTRSLLAVAFLTTFAAQSWGQLNNEADVVVSAAIETSAGDQFLVINAKVRDGLHIYAQSQPRPFLASRIEVTETTAGVKVGDIFRADREPILLQHPQLDVELHEFEGTVTWKAPLQTTNNVQDLVIRGTLFAQACEDGRCFQPMTYPFEASFGQSPEVQQPTDQMAIIIPPTPPSNAEPNRLREPGEAVHNETPTAKKAFSLDNIEVASTTDQQSAWAVLPLSFLAGFLLNFMPCVLPVVGLKLLSFVQQAQSDRRRILLMNLSYTAGLLSVMLVLASLAVFAGLGWREQFSLSLIHI